VEYSTPMKKLEAMPTLLRDAVTSSKDTEFSRAHFFQFGESSLIFEIVYHVMSDNYDKYMDTQQEINFKILKSLEKEGITMAFPTQTVIVRQETVPV